MCYEIPSRLVSGEGSGERSLRGTEILLEIQRAGLTLLQTGTGVHRLQEKSSQLYSGDVPRKDEGSGRSGILANHGADIIEGLGYQQGERGGERRVGKHSHRGWQVRVHLQAGL